MRLCEPGNSAYVEAGIWHNARQDTIHITIKGADGFHTTVNGRDESKRGHPDPYMKLARALRDAGAPLSG